MMCLIVVQGSLLAGACATMVGLDSLSDVNLSVRAIFTISLMLSLVSVYFTLLQQRELSSLANAKTLRDWLWNGRYYVQVSPGGDAERLWDDKPARTKQSSLSANILLQAPFELLGIAITLFLGGVAAYLALVMKHRITLGTGGEGSNIAAFVVFVISTTFTLLVFGQALGQKDREKERCEKVQISSDFEMRAEQRSTNTTERRFEEPSRD